MPTEDPFAHQLAELTDALDEPGTDLAAIISVLVDDVRSAVRSFLGLTITLAVEGLPVLLIAVGGQHIHSAGTSLRMPLHLPGSAPLGHIIFYARNVKAFASLAQDAGRSGTLVGRIVVDQDLPGPRSPPNTGQLADRRDVDQAIGVLIERGRLPDLARGVLDAEAAAAGITVGQAARRLLETIEATPTDAVMQNEPDPGPTD